MWGGGWGVGVGEHGGTTIDHTTHQRQPSSRRRFLHSLARRALCGRTGQLSAPLIVLMEPTTIKSAVPRRLSSKSAVWANGPIVSPPLVPSWCPILVPHSCAPPGALPGGLLVPPLAPQYCKMQHKTQNRLCRSLDGSQYIYIYTLERTQRPT